MDDFNARVAKACDVSGTKAYEWSIGHSLPSKKNMAKMLGIALLDENWNTNPTLSQAAETLFPLYQAAQATIGDRVIEPLKGADFPSATDKPTTKVTPSRKTSRSGAGSGPRNKPTVNDSDGMPMREIFKPENAKKSYYGVRYDKMDDEELQEIQANSQSFPELLHVSRLLLQPTARLSKSAFVKRMKRETEVDISRQSLQNFETGSVQYNTSLPDQKIATALAQTLFPADEAQQQRVVTMADHNTIQVALKAYQHPDSQHRFACSNREERLPAEYFIEKLQRCHEDVGQKRTRPTPEWLQGKDIVPIERNYQYLFTLRHAMELGNAQNAGDLLGFTGTSLQNAESYQSSRQNTAANVFSSYQDYAAKVGKSDLLNKDAFNMLGDGPLQSYLNRMEAEKAAEQAGHGK